MTKVKIAITLDARILAEADSLVARGRFANRSQAIEAALKEQLDRERRVRLARESARLDAAEERRHADEGLDPADQWPEY